MTPEEKNLYEKAAIFISKNLNNPDFNSVLKEYKVRVIPSSLSYVIQKLQDAGYVVSKPSVNESHQTSLDLNNVRESLKSISVKVSSLINNTDISLSGNTLVITFNEKAYYQKKQLLEDATCLTTIKETIQKTYGLSDIIVQ